MISQASWLQTQYTTKVQPLSGPMPDGAVELLDSFEYLSDFMKSQIFGEQEGLVIRPQSLRTVLQRNASKFLSRFQVMTFTRWACNWNFEAPEILVRDLHECCKDYLSIVYLRKEHQLAYLILSGLTREVMDVLTPNSIFHRENVASAVYGISEKHPESVQTCKSLVALIVSFDKLSHDGYTILPGLLLSYARRHNLEHALFD
jgi:hypothetical protein